MRAVVMLLIPLAALAACTQANINRVDARTYSIEGPIVPGGSDAPNRRAALRVCPNGYRVIDRQEHRNPFGEAGVETDWKVRCL